ncbi:MAG: hypothetical protein J0L97_10030 [Alphaproteobacteria bacterium]|nr:hypothetical protein [Alphaproteobacteria bacterium]
MGFVMITDISPYREYVDQFDLTEEQKVELVNAVWVILENYFDQRLGLNQLKLLEKEPQKSIDSEPQASIIEETLGNTG